MISEFPAVLSGGPQAWIPQVTKKWVGPIFLWPHANSYWMRVTMFSGKSCP